MILSTYSFAYWVLLHKLSKCNMVMHGLTKFFRKLRNCKVYLLTKQIMQKLNKCQFLVVHQSHLCSLEECVHHLAALLLFHAVLFTSVIGAVRQ